MSHFNRLFLVTTFGIETHILQRAIENALVTAHVDGNTVECFDQLLAEVFALMVFCDGDILDVAADSEIVNTIQSIVRKLNYKDKW